MSAIRIALTAALGAAGLAFPAMAQANDTDYCVDYDGLYEDAGYFDDDIITHYEYDTIGDQWFTDWDVDRSGSVDETEFVTCYDAIGWDPGDSFVVMDIDGDGALDEEEFFNEDSYDAWDADNDDEVKAGEWW